MVPELHARRGVLPRHVAVLRVAGVRVGLTPWLVLAALGLVGVGSAGAAPVALALAGLGTVVVGSLLVHELAHGLVARQAGFEIDGVVLGLVGALVAYSGPTPAPSVEIRIAAAGPFASGVLACLLALAAPALGDVGAVHSLVLVGAWVNLANAVVNLLPLPSCDGWRIAGALVRGRRSCRPVPDRPPVEVAGVRARTLDA